MIHYFPELWTTIFLHHGHTVTVTVTVHLFRCPKNKRPRRLPLDIRLSRLHLELPYMQNVFAHGHLFSLHPVKFVCALQLPVVLHLRLLVTAFASFKSNIIQFLQ